MYKLSPSPSTLLWVDDDDNEFHEQQYSRTIRLIYFVDKVGKIVFPKNYTVRINGVPASSIDNASNDSIFPISIIDDVVMINTTTRTRLQLSLPKKHELRVSII